MDHKEMLESLLQVVYLLRGEDGRCDFSEVSGHLYKHGQILAMVDDDTTLRGELEHNETYKQYFIFESEIGSDTTHHYVRFTPEGERLAKDLNQARYQNPQTLFNWGFMGRFDERIEQLAEMALPERWDEGDNKYGVLIAYITNTFKRLLHERKEGNERAIIETEKWAAFNTGLVDRLYDPIFALFSLNKKEGMQKWAFHSWCTPGNRRAGQILSRFFDVLPTRASYFQQPSELLYDGNEGVPTLPFDHIIERLERMPLSFLERHMPEGFAWETEEYKPGSPEFYKAYREALNADEYCQLRLKDSLELSLRRAVKKVAWNYRMAIPVYDAKRRKLMLLIPLALDFKDNDHIDIALMVERAKVSRKYVGHTILTLGMAYRKARMVMKPESDWLYQSSMPEENRFAADEEEERLAMEISESDAGAIALDKSAKAAEEQNLSPESTPDSIPDTSTAFLNQHDNDDIFKPEKSWLFTKVVGKVDLSNFDTSRASAAVQGIPASPLEEGEAGDANTNEDASFPEFNFSGRDFDLAGVYHANYGKPYITSGRYRFEAREFTDDGLIDEDDVIFDVATEENKWKPGIFRFAVNIRIADD